MSGPDLAAALRDACVGEVLAEASLAERTTLRVGGPAAALVRAECEADLAAVADLCARTGRPWLLLGKGSNLLVADEGWPGVVVQLGRAFRGVQVDGVDVVAGGAEPMPALAAAVARHDLAGMAWAIAIPGTVGGAVRMNAGAHGGQMRDALRWIDVARMGRGGRVERLAAEDLEMGYRRTDLAGDALVLRAGLRLAHGDPARIAEEMDAMRRWRREHQPLSEPSCGSVFANPEGDAAGRLIEAAGAKGLRVGGAEVSRKHANFVVVRPGARAADVHALIAEVRRQVAAAHGVTLRPEVVMAGLPPLDQAPG